MTRDTQAPNVADIKDSASHNIVWRRGVLPPVIIQDFEAAREAQYRRDSVVDFVVAKYAKQVQRSGVRAAARNMKKQGYPIRIALAVLLEARKMLTA